MSFFFTKSTLETKRGGQRKGLRIAPVTKQNSATLNRLGCSACPLNKADVTTPKMKPTLVKNTAIYFLGEAPDKNDDRNTGQPLTGVSGNLIKECISSELRKFSSFDNVVRDYPAGHTPTWTEMECCRGHIIASIEQAKPVLIVGLGKAPLSWMLNSTDDTGMRGRVFAVKVGNHQCWFMPTYHPKFVIDNAYNDDKPLNSRIGHCFRMDLKRAAKLVGELDPPRVDTAADVRAGLQCFDGTGAGDLGAVLKLISEAAKAPIKAVDIETSCLRPYSTNSRILTCAISFGHTHFSFALDHPKAGWKEGDRVSLVRELCRLIADNTVKIAHNVPFELEWFINKMGKIVVNHDVWECTMMQAHFLDERRGKQWGDDDRGAVYQNLDFLCKQHFGVAYKSMFKLNKKDMASGDLGEMLIYNAVDTKYTLRLYHWQYQLLKKRGLLKAYKEALPRQPTVALMQSFGIGMSQAELGKIRTKLEDEITPILEEINNLKVIQAFKRDRGEFNPQSGPDLLVVFKDYLKRPEINKPDRLKAFDFDKNSKTKKALANDPKKELGYSLDKGVLDSIDHPLANLIVKLRNRTKLKSTYVDCFVQGEGDSVWPDNKLHTSFNTTFTETGRLSSDGPNLQNFPIRNDRWVRKPIVPPKNHVLLAFDYGQLEACTAAMCSKDKTLVKALWDDYDIHMEWAQKLHKIYPAIVETVDRKFRSIVKNKLVFPAVFGAQNSSIAGYLGIPIEPVDKLMREFWKTFSGLGSWQDRLMKGYYENGYVTSLTGRRHHYPLTRNQAINFPVQGVAADIVCDAMNVLSMEAIASRRYYIHPILNIHDDLTFCVPDDDAILEDAIETISQVMLKPTYNFINVPLSVEYSIGPNWYEMKEIDKIWSHKT